MTTYFPSTETHASLCAKAAAWMQSKREDWRLYLQRRKLYRQALRELDQMEDRDLRNLGLRRCDIPQVAWETAVEHVS